MLNSVMRCLLRARDLHNLMLCRVLWVESVEPKTQRKFQRLLSKLKLACPGLTTLVTVDWKLSPGTRCGREFGIKVLETNREDYSCVEEHLLEDEQACWDLTRVFVSIISEKL